MSTTAPDVRAYSRRDPILLVCGIVAVTLGVATLALILIHIADRYALNASSSVWLGLAADARNGMYFPPVFDGERFAGTRYMPMQVAILATLAGLTGDLLVSGRILGLAASAVLAVTIAAAIYRSGTHIAIAASLAALVVTSGIGILVAAGIRQEAIPTALQVAAILVVARTPTVGRSAIAGVLAALAILAKFSAVTAPIAIVLWLLWKRRTSAAAVHAVVVFGLAGAGLAAIELATGGRMSQNLRELAVQSPSFDAIAKAPTGVLASLSTAPGILLLTPLAVAAIAPRLRRREGHGITIWQLALVIAIGIVLFIYTDPGASVNHLLDVTAFTAIVAGELWPSIQVSRERIATTIFGATIAMAAFATLVTGPGIDLALAARRAVAGLPMYQADVLAPYVKPGDRILSDDAWVPLSVGERPVVLDGFALDRLVDKHPEWGTNLQERIAAKAFDVIVLQYDVNAPDSESYVGPWQWRLPVDDKVIADNYALVAEVRTDGASSAFQTPVYFVYRPR